MPVFELFHEMNVEVDRATLSQHKGWLSVASRLCSHRGIPRVGNCARERGLGLGVLSARGVIVRASRGAHSSRLGRLIVMFNWFNQNFIHSS